MVSTIAIVVVCGTLCLAAPGSEWVNDSSDGILATTHVGPPSSTFAISHARRGHARPSRFEGQPAGPHSTALLNSTLLAQLVPAIPAMATSAADAKDDTKPEDDSDSAKRQAAAALSNRVAQEKKLLETAQATADQALSAREALGKDLQKTLASNPAGTVEAWEKVSAADKRYNEARAKVQTIQDRLNQLHAEFGGLQDQRVAALQTSKQQEGHADEAQNKLSWLQNPFTLTNIGAWLTDHGLKLLAIVVGTLLLSLVVKISGRHLAEAVARGSSRGTAQDRKNRAVTLVGVFRNTASIALITGGSLMALDVVSIPIAPLMGGAAVMGLAVAFGAQNLIRDYFSGFMVLLEDQYGINDVVKIGDIAGSVEKITLRMTMLRDLEGAVHFVPHGSITVVTNMTHGWSRALIDIGVAYKEDSDRVMRVLVEIGNEVRKDPTYGPLILDGPEMLGLDSLDDSAVMFKFYLKTQPLQRWFVKRELLRRIKNRFDELGIEIPFPQRTVHYQRDPTDRGPHPVDDASSGDAQSAA